MAMLEEEQDLEDKKRRIMSASVSASESMAWDDRGGIRGVVPAWVSE